MWDLKKLYLLLAKLLLKKKSNVLKIQEDIKIFLRDLYGPVAVVSTSPPTL